ncbi:MAG TPA: hypothetical protein VEU11_01665 [Terriglobales bacterium]|nr:hypothetical protein [Terriglobales bacterium]
MATALLLFRCFPRPWAWLGVVSALLVLVAGLCDIFEDIGILNAIDKLRHSVSLTPGDAHAISQWGWTKWILLFVMLPSLAPLVLDRSSTSLGLKSAALRWIGLLFGAWMIWSGFAGLIACAMGNRLRLASAATAFPVLPLYFLPLYALLQDGIESGLDRMMRWKFLGLGRLFSWLAKWTDLAPAPRKPAGTKRP